MNSGRGRVYTIGLCIKRTRVLLKRTNVESVLRSVGLVEPAAPVQRFIFLLLIWREKDTL